MKKRLLVTVLICLAPTWSFAKTLGVVGRTYAFAERDALTEVMERVNSVDWKKAMRGLQASSKRITNVQLDLPRATADRARTVDATYTLDADVPNPQDPSQVLYPKGFAFKPLAYLAMPGCVMFIDGSDKAQRQWLKASGYASDPSMRILLTGGDLPRIEKDVNRPLFFADGVLVERFGITAVPSIACQKGVDFEVHEYKVPSRR